MKVVAVSLLAVAAAITAPEHVSCPSNFCRLMSCASPANCPAGQRLRANHSYCGCCAECVTVIGEGASCKQNYVGIPPLIGCDDNLTCSAAGICVRSVGNLTSVPLLNI